MASAQVHFTSRKAVYIISVAAELAGVHPQTLRTYERKGLLKPARTAGGTRRYSAKDVDRVRLIQDLTQGEGINLAGVITSNQGMFGFSEPCGNCGGSGRTISDPCPTCSGSGTQTRTREVRTRIPAGVRNGARIRLKGKGEAGSYGGPAGDLYVNVHVEPHELFGCLLYTSPSPRDRG